MHSHRCRNGAQHTDTTKHINYMRPVCFGMPPATWACKLSNQAWQCCRWSPDPPHSSPPATSIVNVQMQEYYGIAGQSMWANLGYVCCFFVFFL